MKFLANILAKAGLIVDGTTQLNTIANATIDTDRFLVSDGGVVKYRTGAQLLSDIGPITTSTLKHQVKLGENIAKGQAVYVSSADGTNMIVSKASNTSEATSSKTLGLIETGGVTNAQVSVITEGLLAGLDTSTAVAGDPVWLGTNGNLIFGLVNKPYAPAHLVFIGIVTRVQQNNGEIFVKVQNGFELQEIHNVSALNPTNNDGIFYNSSTQLWEKKSIPTVLGYTPANAARVLTINGVSYDLTADRTWSVGTVTSVAALTLGTTGTDLSSSVANGTTTPVITLNVPTASATNRGALSSTDWTTFNNKQNAITLTTTGSSGSATLISNTLNIPTYTLAGLGGISLTSLSAFVPLVYNNTTGQFSIIQSSGSNDGYLSATDWTTFNNKQNAITLTTTGTSGAATLVGSTLNIPQYQSVLTNPITGTGTSGQVSYFNGTNSITSSPTFAFTPTSQLLVNNSVTASSSIARGINATPTLTAAANNDVLVGLDINPTFTNGAFTGVSNLALRVQNGNGVLSWNQNATTELNISNTTSGTNSQATLKATSSGGNIQLGKYSATTTAYKIISSNNGFIYNSTSDLAILADQGGSSIKMTANGATLPHLQIFSTGNVGISQTTDAGFRLDVNGTARVQGHTTITNGLLVSGGLLRVSNLAAAGTAFTVVDDNGTFIRNSNWNYDRTSLNTWIGGSQQTSSLFTLNSTTQGFLPPRMTTANRDAISTPATGLSVYNTSTNTNDYYNGSAWLNVGQVLAPANNTTGFSISGSSLTGSNAQSLVSLSQTWNTTGNPTAFLLNITNTASGATADLMDLQVGGASRFEITAAGRARLGAYGSGTITGTATYNLAVDASGNVIEVTGGGGGGGIGGSGTTNRIAKFTSSTAVGNSSIEDLASSVAMTISSGGNLGLGVVPNSSWTSTRSILQFGATGSLGNNSGNTLIGENYYTDAALSNRYLTTNFATVYQQTVGTHVWYIAPSGTAGNAITFTQAMTLNASGNLGINTSTIGSRLQVNGNAAIGYSASTAAPTNGLAVSGTFLVGTTDATNTDKARINNDGTSVYSTIRMSNANSTANMYVGVGGSAVANTALRNNAYVWNAAATALAFGTSDVEAMRITSGGASASVGIGTSTIGSKLQVNGNAAIGYSASTAAPTNGLAVAGNIALNSTISGWTSLFNVIEGTTYSGYLGFQTNAADMKIGVNHFYDGTGATGYKYKTTNSATQLNISASNGFQVNTAPSGTAGTNIAAFTPVFSVNISGVTFLGNGETAGTPTLGIISGTGGTGTNVAGAEFRIRGGASTGSGAGGPITFYTSAAGSAGTTVNAGVERMRIYSDGMVRTFMSTTNTTQYFSSARITIQQTSATNNNFANLSFLGANSDDAAAIYSQISAHTAGATSGNLVFATSNAASSSTARMTITSTGLVGINTQTIGSQLQVNGNAAIGYSASTAAPTNGLMVAGNVGVNVTPSAWASGFRAIQIGARTALFNSDINFTTLGNNIFYDGVSYKYITSAAASSIDLGAGVISFGNAPSGTAGATATGVERARIHTDGIFYIGNGDVVGTPNTGIVSATGGSGTNVAGAEFRIRGGASTGSGAGGPITFYTSAAGASGTTVRAATERMRITTSGSVGIGTINPTGDFEVRGATNTSIRVSSTGNFPLFQLRDDRATVAEWNIENGRVSSGTLGFYYATGSATRMIITSAGNVGIQTETVGSALQINGGAAIGYSASTAAPTNGLQVAGSITGASNSNTFGTSSASGYPVIVNTGTGSNSIKINGRNNAPNDESGIEFFRFDGVTRVAFIQASTNFFAFATSSEAMRINSSNFLGIGTQTIGSRLQVNGGAAIGYSASTAAPTNGLIVAGQSTFNDDMTIRQSDANTTNYFASPRLIIQNTSATVGNFENLSFAAANGDDVAAIWAINTVHTATASTGQLVFGTTNAGSSSTERMRITNTGEVQLKPAANTAALTTSGSYSLTGANAQSLIDLAGTWNTTGNPTAIKLNITNTASGANSLLMDLQVGGNPEFRVTRTGNVVVNGSTSTYQMHVVGTGSLLALGEESFTTGRQMLFGVDGSGNGEIQSVQQGTSYRNLSINPLGGNVGIATSSPTSTLHANGSVAKAITTKTATYTLTSSDHTVIFNLNGNATANLPDATTCTGRIYMIKINRTNTTDTLTIDPNGTQTIDGFTTYALQCQYAVIIQSDGSNWQILGDFANGTNCL